MFMTKPYLTGRGFSSYHPGIEIGDADSRTDVHGPDFDTRTKNPRTIRHSRERGNPDPFTCHPIRRLAPCSITASVTPNPEPPGGPRRRESHGSASNNQNFPSF